jgi:hypothetical protein
LLLLHPGACQRERQPADNLCLTIAELQPAEHTIAAIGAPRSHLGFDGDGFELDVDLQSDST